jgi:hypothetical protein
VDRLSDKKKLIVTFRNFAKAPKNNGAHSQGTDIFLLHSGNQNCLTTKVEKNIEKTADDVRYEFGIVCSIGFVGF